jgi:serine/alanine adding enzyme
MIRSEESTRRHTPYAIGALDTEGKLCAILVAVRVSTLAGLGAQMSTRSIMYAEPICLDSEAGRIGLQALIQRHDRDMCRNVLFGEIRPNFNNQIVENALIQGGYKYSGYLNFEIDLNQSEDELFHNMNTKRRNNVRSAMRRGVEIKESDFANGIEDLYRLISYSYMRSKIPFVDSSLFYSVARQIDPLHHRLLVAYYNGEPVSAGLFLAYKDRVVCWYAGTKRITGVHSMSLLFWEAIKQFSKEGYAVFDLAGAGWEGEPYGPGKFKSKFGGKETNNGRYRKVYSPWKLLAANTAYQIFRRWDMNLGMSLSK